MSILIKNYKRRRYPKYYCRGVASICLALFSTITSAFAVTGTVDAPYSPWVLKIYVAFPQDNFASCTGIQISSQWVLTAMHCYNASPDGVASITAIRSETIGSNFLDSETINFDLAEPLIGDLVALRLTERNSRFPFAPLNLFTRPEDLTQSFVTTYGYGPAGESRLGAARGLTFMDRPDRRYQPGREVITGVDHAWGQTQNGDSGGPVLSNGFVVGIHSSVNHEDPPQTLRFWTPLIDSANYISQYLQPTFSDSIGETNHQIMTAWHAVDCLDIPTSRQRRSAEPDEKTNTCPNITGFKLFYKKTTENPSWLGAESITITRDELGDLQKIIKTTITVEKNENKNQLWSITVLPVDKTGRVLGADVNNLPRDGDASNEFITATTEFAMPRQLRVDPPQDTAGFVRVSWSGAYSKIVDKVKGYALYYKQSDKMPASWENSTRLFIEEKRGRRIPAYIPKDNKPYAMIVLPVVDEDNTTIGVNDQGLPFPKNLSNDVLIAGPPKLRYQYPEAGGLIKIDAGRVNASGIAGSFDLAGQATYQWYYSDSDKPDAKSVPVSSDYMNGGTSPILSFGTTTNPTSEKNSGWYKLVTTNAFGTAESLPVHVIIKK